MMQYDRARGKSALSRTGLSGPVVFFKVILPCALAATLLISGCSSKRSAFHGKGSPTYRQSGPVPKGGGVYKVGNPYQIAGRWYHPKIDDTYDRTGVASWYGPKFHRRMTSNGEWFDMNRISAAHPTLPLPSYARVTNLENGRAVVVRINDRGPYAHDRMIDLSKQAADTLGFIRNGTAKVRVQYVGRAPLEGDDPRVEEENRRLIARNNGSAKPFYTASARKRAVPNPVMAQKPVIMPATGQALSGRHYVQVAAYANEQNARRARTRVAEFGNARLVPTRIGRMIFHRVRIGPFDDQKTAVQARTRAVGLGFESARIVVLR